MAVRGGGSADKPGRQLIYDPLAKSWEGIGRKCTATEFHTSCNGSWKWGGGAMAKVGLNFSFVVITDGNLT
ncbi:hypothetical protein OUZ56_007988 [Daphnia magna]|uniref:Uncharacterized protein n=1 Tax=Daphnia magna TaxID=35525 RepID=A0ABR0ABX0_9CRUS|nr:hypothetical protein OUZ56_007988 [Daphnia magna]